MIIISYEFYGYSLRVEVGRNIIFVCVNRMREMFKPSMAELGLCMYQVIALGSLENKCVDNSMEVELLALLGNYN